VAKLAAPVISVGNLTTGGTGKTPMTEWVCRALAGKQAGKQHSGAGDAEGSAPQKKVCVLTRGYGRANPKSQVLVSNGTELLAAAHEAGDEPFLLAQNLIGIAAVIANPNRVAAGEWAIENLGSEIFVLDDGFQHLRLARDLDIVTIDATNSFGDRLLPAGQLREPLSGLSRADCVVITRTDQDEDRRRIRGIVEELAGPIPVFSSRMVTSGIRKLGRATTDHLEITQQPFGAFCGVGNPDSFFRHLRREGCPLAFTRRFADHYHYQQSDLDQLVALARSLGTNALITTAKDATKLASLSLEIPCYVLEIQISIDDEDRLVQLIQHAYQKKVQRQRR
jgi:tetraacyldisaccharide 4'-kinase